MGTLTVTSCQPAQANRDTTWCLMSQCQWARAKGDTWTAICDFTQANGDSNAEMSGASRVRCMRCVVHVPLGPCRSDSRQARANGDTWRAYTARKLDITNEINDLCQVSYQTSTRAKGDTFTKNDPGRCQFYPQGNGDGQGLIRKYGRTVTVRDQTGPPTATHGRRIDPPVP